MLHTQGQAFHEGKIRQL